MINYIRFKWTALAEHTHTHTRTQLKYPSIGTEWEWPNQLLAATMLFTWMDLRILWGKVADVNYSSSGRFVAKQVKAPNSAVIHHQCLSATFKLENKFIRALLDIYCNILVHWFFPPRKSVPTKDYTDHRTCIANSTRNNIITSEWHSSLSRRHTHTQTHFYSPIYMPWVFIYRISYAQLNFTRRN